MTARLEGVSLGTAMEQVQRAVRELKVPPAIRIEYGGAYEEQQNSFRDLVLVLVLAVVLVFIVLLFEFGDFAAPVAILSSAILSTSGVFLALLVTGTTFNVSSFMGLIMVIGIVAKNGILLLDADQKYRADGLPSEEAIIAAGDGALRPIVMTALATMAGMIPLALAIGAGSQMLQPLAIAVIGGIAGLDGAVADRNPRGELLHHTPVGFRPSELRARMPGAVVPGVVIRPGHAITKEKTAYLQPSNPGRINLGIRRNAREGL